MDFGYLEKQVWLEIWLELGMVAQTYTYSFLPIDTRWNEGSFSWTVFRKKCVIWSKEHQVPPGSPPLQLATFVRYRK